MSQLVVVKFGGSSLASLELIQNCAEKALKHYPSVVVVSAMGKTTDDLQNKLSYFSSKEEIINDFTLSSGEQVSAGLFAAALESKGQKAWPICGWQLPIKTEKKNIISVGTTKIIELLSKGYTPVITGFQGIGKDGAISTLTRGGSDVTAIAVAAALSVDCYIYTDVDGVYEVDPRLEYTKNQKFVQISHDQMLNMSLAGAKVLHPEAVRIAKENKIKIHVKSSFKDTLGTIIEDRLAT